jgi:acetone carboxylase gamma subunit
MASQEAVDMTEWPVIRPAECPDCPPVDICPVDILAQRQHVWIARPTLEAFDQEWLGLVGTRRERPTGAFLQGLADSED